MPFAVAVGRCCCRTSPRRCFYLIYGLIEPLIKLLGFRPLVEVTSFRFPEFSQGLRRRQRHKAIECFFPDDWPQVAKSITEKWDDRWIPVLPDGLYYISGHLRIRLLLERFYQVRQTIVIHVNQSVKG